MPKISVLIPVYNAEKYISEALTSILDQTFTDFEVLVLNDGSTDNSIEIVEELIQTRKDNRIRIIQNEKNMGLSATLNRGMMESKGEFIARMDSDDISEITRFEKQIDYFAQNPEIDILGTGYSTFGVRFPRKILHPQTNEAIKAALMFDSAFAHPTVMMKRSSLLNNHLTYDGTRNGAEDFDLWTRASFKLKFANLNEVLLRYRVHQNQISTSKRDSQMNLAEKIREKHLSSLGIQISIESLKIHHLVSNLELERFDDELARKAGIWLREITSELDRKLPELAPSFMVELKKRFTMVYHLNNQNRSLKNFIKVNGLYSSDFISKRQKYFLNFRAFAKRIYSKIRS